MLYLLLLKAYVYLIRGFLQKKWDISYRFLTIFHRSYYFSPFLLFILISAFFISIVIYSIPTTILISLPHPAKFKVINYTITQVDFSIMSFRRP